MERCVHELLEFYQREIREHEEGRELLKRFGITSLEVIDHFKLGYCSGKALSFASDRTAARYKKLGLVKKAREIFEGCIVFPVTGNDCELVDLFGMRLSADTRRYYYWKKPSQGLVGIESLRVYPELILTENVQYALQVRQLGFPNILSLREPTELKERLSLLKQYSIQKLYLVSRRHRSILEPILREQEIPLEVLNTYSSGDGLIKENFASVGIKAPSPASNLQIVSQDKQRLVFAAQDISYRVDVSGLSGMRTHIRAERDPKSYLDRVDLGSASARQRFAKGCAMALLVSSLDIENHLTEITAVLDTMQEEMGEADRPRELTEEEKAAAMALLTEGNVLEIMSRAMEKNYGIVGEEANRKLALLIGASRLLDKPLGCIIRGAASSGKSSLIQAAARLLPERQVLNFSRLTSQALYFLPKESLMHSVMVVDEYEGLSDSEYSLRTLMSSQMLSLAITVRDGGGLPTTKTVHIPAKVAVFVSTTTQVNDENLSRFVELSMDTSPEQTQRVLTQIAASAEADMRQDDIGRIRDANQILKPCQVVIPFSDKLVFGNTSVLARRQFSHVIGLVASHAALFQLQRQTEKLEDGVLRVTAQMEDYRVVHELTQHVVHSVEENLSPAAMELLHGLHEDGRGAYTIKGVMKLMGWSYSRSYRRLGELAEIRLATPDQNTNGVERVYEIAPYSALDAGLKALPLPEEL